MLIGSLNPANGKEVSDMALLVDGSLAIFAAQSELQLRMVQCGDALSLQAIGQIRARLPDLDETSAPVASEPSVAWRSEGAIRDEIVRQLARAGKDSRVDIALFYLSERTVIDALTDAASRGVRVRLLLDANRDAFGRRKTGVPNRPVAAELVQSGCEVRWAATDGEQFHSKVMRIRDAREDGTVSWFCQLDEAQYRQLQSGGQCLVAELRSAWS